MQHCFPINQGTNAFIEEVSGEAALCVGVYPSNVLLTPTEVTRTVLGLSLISF